MCLLQVVPESLYDAFYRLTDYRTQIQSYVFDVVRATVPKINLDDVFVVRIIPLYQASTKANMFELTCLVSA